MTPSDSLRLPSRGQRSSAASQRCLQRLARRARARLLDPLWFAGEGWAYRLGLQGAMAAQAGAEQRRSLLASAGASRFFIDVAHRDQIAAALCETAADARELIVGEAERACEHVFDLLGSGPVPLGDKIDWHRDFRSGYRWNPRAYHKHIRPAPYPGGYDIKVPWELSRCQHLVRLGQAYWLTGDERYAREFRAEVEGWIAENPWPWGVNWACTMEVAIRAVSWLWAYHFFRESPSVAPDFLAALCGSLWVHGRHIMRNLERAGGEANNHYLADLAGLVFLGVFFRATEEGRQWLELGVRELWQELQRQVHPDGVSFECATAYHRFVTELALTAVILCQLNEIPVPQAVMAQLERMCEFVMCYTRPDGSAPAVGDADNGRLQRLAVWARPEREWTDHRGLLAVGAVLFARDDMAEAAGEQWQDALWLLGGRAIRFRAARPAPRWAGAGPVSRAFATGGFYVMRHGEAHMIIGCGAKERTGYRGHAHNDTLSFELYSGGVSWIIDPGTYTYTADYRARDRFRSTAYHNIVTVDGQEINRFQPKSVFGLADDAMPRVDAWQSTAEHDLLDASHAGYGRLAAPVICRRRIWFAKRERYWAIQDLVFGQGAHALALHLHLGVAGVALGGRQAPAWLRMQSGEAALTAYVLAPAGAQVSLSSGERSSSYGQRTSAPVAAVSAWCALPAEFLVLLLPSRAVEAPLAWPRIRALAAAIPWPEATALEGQPTSMAASSEVG